MFLIQRDVMRRISQASFGGLNPPKSPRRRSSANFLGVGAFDIEAALDSRKPSANYGRDASRRSSRVSQILNLVICFAK